MCATCQTLLAEVLLISEPKPEETIASIEQSVESQVPTTSLSLGGGEDPRGNALLEESKDDNEIITTVDDLVAHDSAAAQPTLDNFVKDPELEESEVIGEEPGEVKELVEDTAESSGIAHQYAYIYATSVMHLIKGDSQSCLLDYKIVWQCIAADFKQLKSLGKYRKSYCQENTQTAKLKLFKVTIRFRSKAVIAGWDGLPVGSPNQIIIIFLHPHFFPYLYFSFCSSTTPFPK